jgi:hypothetical protein
MLRIVTVTRVTSATTTFEVEAETETEAEEKALGKAYHMVWGIDNVDFVVDSVSPMDHEILSA